MLHKSYIKKSGWLLIIYTVPSKPVNNRMKIWRKLANAGAVQIKGAVYILPYNEENYEFFQWLISEVISMGGEGAFVKVQQIETMKDNEIIVLFNKQRESEYKRIEKGLDEFERKLSSIKKGSKGPHTKTLFTKLNKYKKEYEDIRKRDFFSSKPGLTIENKLKDISVVIKDISGFYEKRPKTISGTLIPLKKVENYKRKIWVTREKPFVDRMASAWLIKKFIDKKASFQFIDEKEIENLDKSMIVFDMRGGEFTHVGDLCTFEVLLKAFGLKNKTLKKIAEIVHELDVKDEKFEISEAKGIEEILIGIRKTLKDNTEALEKGMAVFEMLYASKT